MIKYTFEQDTLVTEQTTVKANSLEEAENMLLSGDCKWEETKGQGGDWELIIEELGHE